MIKYIKSNYIMLFLLIPFFKPICFQYYSALQGVENLFVGWKILSAAVCFVFVVSYMWSYSRLPKMVVLVFLFEICIVVSTLINRGDLMRALIDMVSIVSYTALLILGIKYNGSGIVHLLSRLLGILLLVNLLSVIFFPTGLPADLYTNPENPLYFMVIDNGSALFLIFSIAIFAIDGLISQGSVRLGGKISILCAILNAVLVKSATAIFTVVLLCIALLFILKSDFSKHQNPAILFLVYIGVFSYLITMQDNIVSEFILKNIKAQPWFGYGRSAQDYISAWGGYFSSHNYVLETLLQGGIISLGVFILTVVFAIKKSLYTRHLKITAELVFGMITVLIAALMEATVHSVYIFGIISLCAGSYYLEVKQEKKEEWIKGLF